MWTYCSGPEGYAKGDHRCVRVDNRTDWVIVITISEMLYTGTFLPLHLQVTKHRECTVRF